MNEPMRPIADPWGDPEPPPQSPPPRRQQPPPTAPPPAPATPPPPLATGPREPRPGDLGRWLDAAAAAPRENLGNQTMAIDRVFPALKNPPLTLQFYNTTRRGWSDLKAVRGSSVVVGRADFLNWNPSLDDLAEQHLRLVIDEQTLVVMPLPSLNGVYVKMKPGNPAELRPGSRFRIGRHVLAYRPFEPDREDVEPLRSREGEVFHSRILRPMGFLDLIGPDGEPCVSHPLTKADEPGTRIGRGGARCDLALTGDEWVSGEHARVYLRDGRCFLEDLRSTNGTFLQIHEEVEIERGTVLRDDSGDVIALGGYMVRIVEERA